MVSEGCKNYENRLKGGFFVQFCPVFQGVNFHNSFTFKQLQYVQPQEVDI